MSLDDKLREILTGEGWNWPDMSQSEWDEWRDDCIAQIKQVFEDDGYVKAEDDIKVDSNQIRIRDIPFMTGQEWLSNFDREWLATIRANRSVTPGRYITLAHEAAKKASGL